MSQCHLWIRSNCPVIVGACCIRDSVRTELGLEHLTRLQSPNTGVKCLWCRDVEERSEIIECLPVRTVVDTRQLKQGPDLAGEHESLRHWCIKQGFDPETVPG